MVEQPNTVTIEARARAVNRGEVGIEGVLRSFHLFLRRLVVGREFDGEVFVGAELFTIFSDGVV